MAIVTLLLGSSYSVNSLEEMMKWEVVEQNTYDLEFEQSTEFVSTKPLINENASIVTTPEKIPYDAVICGWLKDRYSSWDCTPRQGGTNNDHWFSPVSDYDILENEEYTLNARVEYRYRLNHSGTVTVKETITSTAGQASSVSHQLMNTDEVFNLSLKTSIVFEIHRRYTPVGYEHIIQTFSFNVPFPTLVDVDGDGTYRDLGFTIPVVNTNRVYLWDNFTAISNATSVDQLGENVNLSGYVNLVEIDLIEFSKSVLQGLGAGTGVALALNILTYFIEIWLTISLDVDFHLQALAQIHVANDVNTLQEATDSHAERMSGGQVIAFTDGRSGDSATPLTTSTTQSDPTEVELLAGLGFTYIGNSTESYSINIEIRPSSKRICVSVFCASIGKTLWELKGWPNPIRIPLAAGLFSSSSSHFNSTMTTSVHTTTMPTLPTPPPPNTAPQASASLSATELQTGQTLIVTTSGSQDADGDSIEAQVNWGDGGSTAWTSSTSHTHSYISSGTYTVTTRVRDDLAMSEPDSSTVVITEPSYNGEVSITASEVQVEANDSISFTVSLSNISSPSSILLSYGDGTNQTLNSGGTHSHTYTGPGLFGCSVLVQDGTHLVSDSVSISVIPDANPPAQIQSTGNVSLSNYSTEASGDTSSTNSTSYSTSTEGISVEAHVNGAYINMTSLSTSESYSVTIELLVWTENRSTGQYEWMELLWDYDSYSSPSSTESWNYSWDHLWIDGTHHARAVLYDSVLNQIANATVDLNFDVPDLPKVNISDSGILLVIDTENQNYSAQASAWNSSFVNPTGGEASVLQAALTVANIVDTEFDLLFVGDTDRDGLFDTYGMDGPGLGTLQQYGTVIWITGAHYFPLTNADEYHLSTYVNSGGSLILFSQDYLWGTCSYCDQWDYATFANRTLGIRDSAQESGLDGLYANSGGGNTNIAYLLTAGLDNVTTRNLMLNGTIQPFEDWIYPAIDDLFTLEAIQTNDPSTNSEQTVGITRMLSDEDGRATGRLSFFAFDPASIETRYDLERLLLQAVNWSAQSIEDEGLPENAAPVHIGLDGLDPIFGSGYQTNWYSIHPEPGRTFHLEFVDAGILSVDLYDESGTTVLASFSSYTGNNTWWIDTTSASHTVYLIKLTIWNSVADNWLNVESQYLYDANPNCLAYPYIWPGRLPPLLSVGAAPFDDILTPYLSQGPAYDGSCFDVYLQTGKTYAVTMLVAEEINSNSNGNDTLSFYMDVEDPGGSGYWFAEAVPGSIILEAIVNPSTTGYHTISVSVVGYENPYLFDGNYQIQVWELPSSHPSDDTNATAPVLSDGFAEGWIDSVKDSADRITWDVFDGEAHEVWISFDRVVNGTVTVWWAPEDPLDPSYLIGEYQVQGGAWISIDEDGMGSIILEVRSNQGRANYTIFVDEQNPAPQLPFGDIMFSELGQIDGFDTWTLDIMTNLPVVITMSSTYDLFTLPGVTSLSTWAEDPDGNIIMPSSGDRFTFESAVGGTYTIHVNGAGGGYWIWAFVDDEPVVMTEPTTSAMVDEPYASQFEAFHSINSITRGWYLTAQLTYSIESGPAGLTIDSESGNMSMLPVQGDIGAHNVTILVESAWIIPLRYDFTLTILDQPNSPPEFDPILDVMVVEGELVQFTISARDPDGDSMSISMEQGPPGAQFDSATWTASWTPLQSGNYMMNFRIVDARGASATTEMNITVVEPNQPIVRITATASDWVGLATQQAQVTLDVDLENASVFECVLLYPQNNQRIDSPCTLVWADIVEGNHVVSVQVRSGVAQTVVDVQFFVGPAPVLDDDGDGVANEVDDCPATESGVEVDPVGCAVVVPVDTDGDGIADSLDDCPDEPGPSNNQGCAVVDGGVVDETDSNNSDNSNSKLSSDSTFEMGAAVLIGGISIVALAILAILLVIAARRRNSSNAGFGTDISHDALSPSVTAPPPPAASPVTAQTALPPPATAQTAPPPPPPAAAPATAQTAPPPPAAASAPAVAPPPPMATPSTDSGPDIDASGQSDPHGFEWTTYENGKWYRRAGLSEQWKLWVD